MKRNRNRPKRANYRCCPRAYTPEVDHGFGGIGGSHADTRFAIENGASKTTQLKCGRRSNEMIVTEHALGLISKQSAADEAETNVQILGDAGLEDPQSTIASRLLLHQDRVERTEWELKESHRRMIGLADRLESKYEAKVKKGAVPPKGLEWELALTFAARATVAEAGSNEAFEFARRAVNLTYLRRHIAWFVFLQILRKVLVDRGQYGIALGLPHFPGGLDAALAETDEFMLSREMWGL